jgi:energy-coupling factor transporter ATP-binding protein EcfA2
VILGKNGCGKSFLLKRGETHLRRIPDFGLVRYVSPERGGHLVYDPGIEHNIVGNPAWMNDARRANQSANFRQQSAALFRTIEITLLRQLEDAVKRGEPARALFDRKVDLINSLLDRVIISRDRVNAFNITVRDTGGKTDANEISSGEAELISLGIELLSFAADSAERPSSILLIDEPDVHLHPDLQNRLANFILQIQAESNFSIILATHSTALLASLATSKGVRVAFMQRGDRDLNFKLLTEVDKKILPMFGAHPLSNVFNERPILLVEGDDEDRIWQQAVRSSIGRIKVYPCSVDGIGNLPTVEREADEIIGAVYDSARGCSLRDRDDTVGEIESLRNLKRFRLSCRASENLLLSDDVLGVAATNWTALRAAIETWIGNNRQHTRISHVRSFADGGYNRKDADIKDIRNIIIYVLGTNKPWEVLVGQGIAGLNAQSPSGSGSLRDFLGSQICTEILRI